MALFILSVQSNFEHIIGLLLNNWNPLKVALTNGKGGSPAVRLSKINDLIHDVFACLKQADDPLRCLKIADLIEDVMEVGFNSVLESPTADIFSSHIIELYTSWDKPEKREKVITDLKNLPIPIPIQVDLLRSKQEKQKEDDSSNEVL